MHFIANFNPKIHFSNFQVRGYGLNAPELLSVAVSAADRLPPCPKGTVFDTENVFLNSKGELVVSTLN